MKSLLKFTLILVVVLSAGFVFAFDEENAGFPEYGVSAAIIAAYPEPNVTPIDFNRDLIHDRWYKRVTTAVDVFDAPGGNYIRTIPEGFNFITALKDENGWTRINRDEWVLTENLNEANGIVSQFTGVLLPEEGLPYTMAWALVNVYPSHVPGAEPDESQDLIYRYTRLNVYDFVEIEGYRWYQVGVDQWVHQFNVAKIIPIERPEDVDTDIWVSLDLYEQVLIAYEGETPVYATLIATGLSRWPTREGVYHIYYRHPRKHMSGGAVGDDYYALEEVPWTMFFDEGRALHGAYWHDGFGYRRSHGCVNLSITDAHWLYQWVAEYLGTDYSSDYEEGPAVYVYSTGVYDS